jgi:hypothetical protein
MDGACYNKLGAKTLRITAVYEDPPDLIDYPVGHGVKGAGSPKAPYL